MHFYAFIEIVIIDLAVNLFSVRKNSFDDVIFSVLYPPICEKIYVASNTLDNIGAT